MTIRHLSVRDARARQETGAVYLDVRSIPEFEEGHPEGAYNIPLLHADPQTQQTRPNPDFIADNKASFPADTPLVVGCEMGGRSQYACEVLQNAGFRDVANVLGGWGGAPQYGHEGWRQAGLPAGSGDGGDRSYASLRKKPSGGR
jgi:rhodanese-related sulfurtransferase